MFVFHPGTEKNIRCAVQYGRAFHHNYFNFEPLREKFSTLKQYFTFLFRNNCLGSFAINKEEQKIRVCLCSKRNAFAFWRIAEWRRRWGKQGQLEHNSGGVKNVSRRRLKTKEALMVEIFLALPSWVFLNFLVRSRSCKVTLLCDVQWELYSANILLENFQGVTGTVRRQQLREKSHWTITVSLYLQFLMISSRAELLLFGVIRNETDVNQ